jgi:hypothetical protein
MPRPGFANQQDLLRWAETLNAKHELPRLVRRLILETGVGVTTVDFPASEGTATEGWDGVARTTGAMAFVPAGLSLWELSAGKSTTKKADTDYGKRTKTLDGSPMRKATYCELIVRRWTDRRKWATAKARQRRWKTVRGFGVDDLETWLEFAPITHAWLSELIGLKPYGMRTPSAWWEAWAAATEPQLTTGIVLAGRAASGATLRERLRGSPRVTTLRADSLDEGLAFIAACMQQDDAEGEGALLTRTAFVDDVETWRSLAEHGRPLVLVARTPEVIAEASSAPEHHVIVPLLGSADADMRLEPIDVESTGKALRALGLDERRADEAARLGRRSLLALRRSLARKPELHTPPWAEAPIDRVVRGALLAGSWNDSSAGDQTQLEALTGKPYEELREDLTRLGAAEDPFVTRVDRTWAVVSPFDAWRQLRSQARADDLQRLRDVIVAVLLEDDPTFDLTPEERWRASVDGKTRRHSPDLRSGLANTVALLGVFGEAVDAGQGSTGTAVAEGIVRGLLTAANEDDSGGRWSALADELPSLAEGAPDAFLPGVRAGSTGDEPVLRQIFRDDGDSDPFFATSSPHTGLLWALERVAWSDEHFAQVIYLLARLSEIDPMGSLMTRPFNSLSSIFCPWHPDTTASNTRRLQVLDELRRRYPDIGWRLMLTLLPELYAVHSPTSIPRFRDWRPPTVTVDRLQWHEFVVALGQRLIDDAGTHPSRWQELVVNTGHVSPTQRALIREALDARIASDELAASGREELWGALRELVAKHREFSDAEWALPAEEVDALEALQRRLEPHDAVDRHAWVFEDHMPDLGDASKRKEGAYDHQGYAETLSERRRVAVREVLDVDGWPGVLRIANRAVVPWMVGDALAQLDDGEHVSECLALLEANDDHTYALGSSYLASWERAEDWAMTWTANTGSRSVRSASASTATSAKRHSD